MKRLSSLIAAALFAGMLPSVIAHAEDKTTKREDKFCDALTQFKTDFKQLDDIGPNSSMAELRSATDRVADDAKQVKTTASKIKTESGKEFTNAANQLRTEARALPSTITVQQAKERLRDDLMNVQKAAKKLATESGCPEAAPDMPSGG